MKNEIHKTVPYKLVKTSKISPSAENIPVRWIWKENKKRFVWSNSIERISIVRKGLPYYFIEGISNRLNMPVKNFLGIIGIPQTTYNKKKSENLILDSRSSELLVLIYELLDLGKEVFNSEEEKFISWLEKPNVSLGGMSPESYLDTVSGIEEVKNCLYKLEYGNLA